jgi:hypothetical protein
MRASAVPDDCVITLSVANVTKTLNRSTYTRLRDQTDYQDVRSEPVLTNWQVSSLTFSTCPCNTDMFQADHHSPCATCLNDYRPVALTSVAMKCFERLVM